MKRRSLKRLKQNEFKGLGDKIQFSVTIKSKADIFLRTKNLVRLGCKAALTINLKRFFHVLKQAIREL